MLKTMEQIMYYKLEYALKRKDTAGCVLLAIHDGNTPRFFWCPITMIDKVCKICPFLHEVLGVYGLIVFDFDLPIHESKSLEQVKEWIETLIIHVFAKHLDDKYVRILRESIVVWNT